MRSGKGDSCCCCDPREQTSVYDPDLDKRFIIKDGEVVEDPEDDLETPEDDVETPEMTSLNTKEGGN